MQQYLELAKTSTEKTMPAICDQAINHKDIFVFSELLLNPICQKIKNTKAFKTLELMAYGSWKDYKG